MTNITRIRREVAILANRIHKRANDLSTAFRRAWQIVKGKKLVSKVSGVVYGTRQRALQRLKGYAIENINVELEREAGNSHDANAVKVMVSVGTGGQYHLGYIPRDTAALLAPLLDKGIAIAARFLNVTGGYEGRETYGELIAIEL